VAFGSKPALLPPTAAAASEQWLKGFWYQVGMAFSSEPALRSPTAAGLVSELGITCLNPMRSNNFDMVIAVLTTNLALVGDYGLLMFACSTPTLRRWCQSWASPLQPDS
jgi:hypothetical protein